MIESHSHEHSPDVIDALNDCMISSFATLTQDVKEKLSLALTDDIYVQTVSDSIQNSKEWPNALKPYGGIERVIIIIKAVKANPLIYSAYSANATSLFFEALGMIQNLKDEFKILQE